MSRYYMQYDAYGEPRSLIWPDGKPAAAVTSDQRLKERLQRDIARANAADEIYDRARDQGLSHAEARALALKGETP